MNKFVNIISKIIPLEIDASEIVDKREVIISNATVEEIENAFRKNYEILNNQDSEEFSWE